MEEKEHHERDAEVNSEKAGSGDHRLKAIASNVDKLEVTKERPYREINFIGTYLAVCLGALACYGGFVMPATSLTLIEEDIGGGLSSGVWIVLAWTLCLAVGYTLVGRLSDIFGRRWFFIGASAIATMGCIIGATATHINQLIAGSAFIGLATAAQLSFNYIITELVPMKDRFYVLALIFLFAIPFSAFGPVISRLLIVHTSPGWRWDYYMTIIVNGLSTILYFIFYHPPVFHELHSSKRSKWQEVKDIDIGGVILFLAGFVLLLLGLSWGGTIHPWNSSWVIATIVVGFVVIVIFVLYEIYMPLNRPLVPMHLFKNKDFTILTIVSAVGGMLYYSLNVIYPTMVATLFTTDIVKAGLLSCAIGGGVGAGQFSASLWASPGGVFRWKLFFSVAACTAFTAGLAGAKTQGTASALAVMSAFFIGALESLAGVAVTMVLKDQTEIGVAVGVYGSIRSVAGVLATAIFSTILVSRAKSNTVHNVVPALIKAGVPPKSVEPLLAALGAGDATGAAQVPGVTKQTLGLAVVSLQAAYSNAFTLVFLVTIAFGACSTIASFFAPQIEKYYTGDVMRRLHLQGKRAPGAESDVNKEVVEHKEDA